MASGKFIFQRITLINKYYLIIFLIIIISLFSLKLVFFDDKDISEGLIQEDLSLLDTLLFESGDIILRRGTSLVSSFIARSFPGSHEMSHCGILVFDNGAWQVIHSISGRISDTDGIRIEQARSFMASALRNKVILIKPKFPIDRDLVTQFAWKYLELKPTFDHDFNLEDRDKLYCSELVRAVYLDAGGEDNFIYTSIAGKRVINLTSFFSEQYWSYLFK